MVDIHGGPRRIVALACAVALALTLAACGGDDDPAPGPSEPATVAPVDEATEAFEDYWAVYVQMANSGEISPRGFDGVADGVFLETVLKALTEQADSGVVRVGEPDFGDFSTTVTDGTASSVVCRDDSQWGAKHDGELIEESVSQTPRPRPYVGTLELRGDRWVVTNVELAEGIACP